MADAHAQTTVTPSDDELRSAIEAARATHPDLGILKLLTHLKTENDWTISEKRFRKVLLSSSASSASASALPSSTNGNSHTNGSGEKGGTTPDGPDLIARTGIDPLYERLVEATAPKVKVRMFGGSRGKGLVARSKMESGEVVWSEEPWVGTADPSLYPRLSTRQMCTQCLALFPRPNPPLSVGCTHCGSVWFCNRLCASKARTPSTSAGGAGTHLDLLCPALNPGAEPLLKHVRTGKSRSLEGVARIAARWRTLRESGEGADEFAMRVWEGMARVSQKDKEAERKEWPYTAESRMAEWHTAHSLLVSALNPTPAPKDEPYRAFSKTLRKLGKGKGTAVLTEQEEQRWFSFESFLELLGMVGLNQEDSGGLYGVHSGLNHSCEPNIQVRNLPKTYSPPSQSDLPTDLPPPLEPGVRGTNRLTLLARKTIHPGEELTISYVPLAMPRAGRREVLREQYGFWCFCARCVREKKDEEKKLGQGQEQEGKGSA